MPLGCSYTLGMVRNRKPSRRRARRWAISGPTTAISLVSSALRRSLVGTYMCYSWLLDGPMLLIYIGPTWSQGLNLYGLRLVHGWPSEFLWVAMIQVHELWLPLTLFVIILHTYHKQVSKQHMIVINLVKLALLCLLYITTPSNFGGLVIG